LGSRIGIPTINIRLAEDVVLPLGVYAGECLINGELYKSVANIGYEPTVQQDGQLECEIHVFEPLKTSCDYVAFRPLKKLRDEMKFKDISSLKRQIEMDIRKAKKLFTTGVCHAG